VKIKNQSLIWMQLNVMPRAKTLYMPLYYENALAINPKINPGISILNTEIPGYQSDPWI